MSDSKSKGENVNRKKEKTTSRKQHSIQSPKKKGNSTEHNEYSKRFNKEHSIINLAQEIESHSYRRSLGLYTMYDFEERVIIYTCLRKHDGFQNNEAGCIRFVCKIEDVHIVQH